MGLARRKQKPHKRSVLRKSCTFIEIFFRNRLTKSRRDGKIYRQSAVAVKIESGRVPEWPMGTDCKSAAFQLRWFESTRAHQTVRTRTRFFTRKGSGTFFVYRRFCGRTTRNGKRAKAGYHRGDGILPFVLRDQGRFVRTWSSPYMARLGVIATYVRTGSLYTSDNV